MITATGWTWDQVDSLTWPQVLELLTYWKQQPPTHVLVKAFFMGDKEESRPSEGEDGWTLEKMDELMALFGGAGGQVVHTREG